MATTQYIGSRYVPLFADPIDWDKSKTYEPLTIVTYQGNSYTSKQAVPSNIEITNTDYWALTGNYNAQIEEYRREVQTFDARITATEQKNTEQDAKDTEQDNEIADISSLAHTNESDIASMEGDINGLMQSTKIVSEITPGNVVFVGDSITNGQGASTTNLRWSTRLVGFLNRYASERGLSGSFTERNYAENGTGFAHSYRDNFKAQLMLAANDDAFENNSVTLVFIAGGANDVDAVDNVYVNANDCISYALNTFPNALVCLLPLMWGCASVLNHSGGSRAGVRSNLILSCENAETSRFRYCESCYSWLIGHPTWSDGGSGIHPNDTGYLVQARRIFRWLLSGELGWPGDSTTTYTNVADNVTISSSLSMCANGWVHNYFYMSFDNFDASSNYTHVFNLPALYAPSGGNALINGSTSNKDIKLVITDVAENAGSANVEVFYAGGNLNGNYFFASESHPVGY